jgi:hypothetical protein
MERNEEFQSGERVFLLDGREAEYVSPAGHQRHVIAPIYETDYGDHAGNPEVVGTVCREPPTAKLHAEVEALQARAGELRQQIMDSQRELRDAEVAHTTRLKKLAQFKALERVEDFVEKRITHFVVTQEYGSAVEVVPLDKFIDPEGRNRDVRLLCLFGRSNGDLLWRMNRYYDGSGGWTDAAPCTSEDEAIAQAAAEIRARIETAMQTTEFVWKWTDLRKSAAKYGVEFPADLAQRMDQHALKNAADAVAKRREELAAAEAQLAALATSANLKEPQSP